MGLFTLHEDKIVLDPDNLVIPEFNAIWRKDKEKGKPTAHNHLTVIYFMCDFESPYTSYPERAKKKTLVEDYLGGDYAFVKSKEFKDACIKYKEFQNTPSMRLIESGLFAADKLSDYFGKANFKHSKNGTKEVYDPKVLTVNIKAIGDMVKSLYTLKEQVKTEFKAAADIRGGGEVGSYET